MNVESTLSRLVEKEDTDHDMRITVSDTGPKVISLYTEASGGHRGIEIRGTQYLSNLLQELTLAKKQRLAYIALDVARIQERPMERLCRYIRDFFSDNLTLRLDAQGIVKLWTGLRDWTPGHKKTIYVPEACPEQLVHYDKVAKENPDLDLEVLWLKRDFHRPEIILQMNERPGLLALATEQRQTELVSVPFLSLGDRSYDMAGWAWYTMSLGLLLTEQIDLAKSMVTNLCFSIQHYGKTLPANRSYYLDCSQPPLLTDMALRVYHSTERSPGALDFLRKSTLAAIKEYYAVWTSPPRLHVESGLSRYHPQGKGFTPELNVASLYPILRRLANKRRMGIKDFVKAYASAQLCEPDLDEYLLNKRAILESGYDESSHYKQEGSHLLTVELNALLYKYEVDIARIIRNYFNDRLIISDDFCAAGLPPGRLETSSTWDRRARRRRTRVDQYLWSAAEGMYFDYNIITRCRSTFVSASTLFPLWSGLASPSQALVLIDTALPKFESYGGLLARAQPSSSPTNRQGCNHPFGWAQHQIVAWTGLIRYGHEVHAARLAYKWLWTVTKVFIDYNGLVAEKYDVTNPVDPYHASDRVSNRHEDLKGIPIEG